MMGEDGMQQSTTGLVVIDVQNGFLNRHSRGVLPRVVRLVNGWRAAGRPVVFTRFHNPPGSPYERITGWTRLRTDAEQAFPAELAQHAQAAQVITKGQSSLLTAEGSRLVHEAGWTDVVLCGIDTDACVYDSAVGLYQAGIRPWIVADACASTGGEQYHQAALLLAGRNLGRGQLVTVDQVLTGVAGGEAA